MFRQSWQNDSHYVVLTRNSFVSNSFLIFLHSTLQPLLCKSRPVNFETNLIYGEQKGRSAFTINLAPSSDSFVPRFRTENIPNSSLERNVSGDRGYLSGCVGDSKRCVGCAYLSRIWSYEIDREEQAIRAIRIERRNWNEFVSLRRNFIFVLFHRRIVSW